MPCSYYLPGEEEALNASKLRRELDRLTHENDQLREIALHVHNHGLYQLPEKLAKQIGQSQVEHREEDLRRLTQTFLDEMQIAVRNVNVDAILDISGKLAKVQGANPALPLEPQLGFDPDDY